MSRIDAARRVGVSPRFSRKTIGDLFGDVFSLLFGFIMNTIDLVITPIQRRIGIRRMAYLFLVPNMLIFSIFVLFPMLLNFYYSGTAGTKLFPEDRTWVGTENYQTLFDCEDFTDPNSCNEDFFWRAVSNTVVFVIFQVGGLVLLALLTALILNREIAGRGFFRSVFFYPVLLSPVVVGLIWKWILQRHGLLNGLLETFDPERDATLFLLERNWAAFWVILVSIWAQMGFYTLILLAGLQSIPAVLYEAGQIDGANNWQSFRHITLPLLMPTMFVVLVLSLIRAVQVFDQVFVLTGGGPGTATKYMVQYIYETGFINQIPRRGLAASASVLLGGVLLVFTLFQLWLGRKSEVT
ncbi:MAG: sugar ABC transporter permease [Anaerolineae bacterium]|nr:sugar ABC transporter permease [Anaerolineae bacterium]